MNYNRATLHGARVLADIACLLVSFIAARVLLTNSFTFNIAHYYIMFCQSVIWVYSAHYTSLYDDFGSRNISYELIKVLKNVFVQSLSVIILFFLIRNVEPSRLFVLFFTGFLIFSTGIQKILFRSLLVKLRLFKRNLRFVVIVGTGDAGMKFYNFIKDNQQYGFHIAGLLNDTKHPSLNGEYLGKIDILEDILDKQKIDNVVVALPHEASEKIEEIISICEKYTTRVKIIPDYFNFMSTKYNFTMFGGFPIISVRDDRLSEFHSRVFKRSFDIIFSLFTIVILSWAFPLIYMAVKLSSPGPAIFKQERWGINNKKFVTYKFRSMKNGNSDVDDNGKYRQASKDDPRITGIGRFLRKTNLDELPQFYNVLLGNMSVVGPRPHPVSLNIESREKIKRYMLRHLVKPGITGWAQVNGFRGETTEPEMMQTRIDYDLWYIENWTLSLDIQIIVLTLWRMITGDPKAY